MASDEATRLARSIFTHLCADPSAPASRRLGIPVRLWCCQLPAQPWETASPPPDVPVEAAERSVVVVLLDEHLVAAGWESYFDRFLASVPQGGPHTVIPVSLHPSFTQVAPLHTFNAVRLHDVPGELRCDVLLNRLTHALCRLFTDGSKPVKVFFSHAKRDGASIAQRLREVLHRESGLDDFFDSADIPHGSHFADVIEAEARTCALIAIRTDSYASREWCRIEVLHAKLAGAPIVVVDALDTGETRSFPYLGNVPVVRWQESSALTIVERLLGVLLLEVLRSSYFRRRAQDVCSLHHIEVPERALAYPPELLTLLAVRGEVAAAETLQVLYPDPPLGTEELALLLRFYPRLDPVTPTILVSR